MSAQDYPVPPKKWSDPIYSRFLRLAAGGLVPAKLYQPTILPVEKRQSKTGELNIEIVSHCWQYAHLLQYQLSSLIKFPPQSANITMTVYYCQEDTQTSRLLNYVREQQIDRVTWNWQPLPQAALFRRTIGRNLSALNTKADWIWFTDCDLMFRENCLDELVTQLQGRREALVYPRIERTTSLLSDEDPLLAFNDSELSIRDVDTTHFTEQEKTRATGPLQITHGDVARDSGYCKALDFYMRPSDTWCKAHEDRAFRWLLRTQGTPLDIPGVYRIRHVSKGRYTGGKLNTGMRSFLRRFQA